MRCWALSCKHVIRLIRDFDDQLLPRFGHKIIGVDPSFEIRPKMFLQLSSLLGCLTLFTMAAANQQITLSFFVVVKSRVATIGDA